MKKFEYTEIASFNFIVGNDQFKVTLTVTEPGTRRIDLLKADCDSQGNIMGWLMCSHTDGWCAVDAEHLYIQILIYIHRKGCLLDEIKLCEYIRETLPHSSLLE